MKRVKKKKQSDSEIIVLIEKIAELVREGNSIALSRKLVCGSNTNKLSGRITRHNLYCHVLNCYLADRGYSMRYRHEGFKLRQIKNPKGL